MIGCALATPPIVTTLVSGLDRNTLQIRGPIGGSISAELPSVQNIVPLISQLAPLALSLGGNLGSLGDLASLDTLGSLGDLASLGALGARLLPSLPSVQVRSVPISIPFPYPSFTPLSFSSRSLVPYPYSIYAGARF